MTFNEERLQVAKQTAKFAEVGFMNQVREIAEALAICSKEDVKAISDHLSLAIQAMENADYDVKYYTELCEKEA